MGGAFPPVFAGPIPPEGPAPPEQPQATVPIQVTTEQFAPPDEPTDIPKEHLEAYFRDTASQLERYGVPHWAAALVAGIAMIPIIALVAGKDVAIAVIKVFMPAVGGVVLKALDDFRKELDPQFAKLAVDVLNELLGSTVEPSHLQAGTDFKSHIDRAHTLGGLLHDVLLHEFLTSKEVTPESGERAARIFSGLLINFGTATGILATLGGLAPVIHLDDIREIGEQVASNLGLGRMHRLALKPLIQILIAEPYKWALNKVARPTQFKLGDVVNPFAGTVMKDTDIRESLAREGYSDDKIAALLELHRKKLSEGDLFHLFRGGIRAQEEVTAALKRLGYTHEDALDKAEADLLDAERPYQSELINAVVDAYKFGNIPRSELAGILDGAALHPNERALILLAADYKRKVPHRSLTVAELEKALIEGLIDVAEFTDKLSTFGYDDDDVQILLLLTLLKLGKLADAEKAKAARAAAKSAKAARKGATATTPKAP